METLLNHAGVALSLFHCHAGGFPLPFCTYALLDADSNEVSDLEHVVVVRVTALNGERIRLRERTDIQRFLAAVGRLACEEVPS